VTARISGVVKIVGTGLIGTSIGLALSRLDVSVILEDASPANERLAADYGAGSIATGTETPTLVVVCVPPDVAARVVAAQLKLHPTAVVTDVASVKSAIIDELAVSGAEIQRYVGSHPMAGRERGGAASGRADIFIGRPWVIATHSEADTSTMKLVEELALDLGSNPIRMTPKEHDRAVALVSHVPQLVSSLLAARLVGSNGVELAGQGLRDTVRIAASDPKLWVQILGANASEIVSVLRDYQQDLGRVIEALSDVQAAGALSAIDQAIAAGNRGVEQLPGKHGSKRSQLEKFIVVIEDRPGELARLFNEVTEIGINVEDLKLEHNPGVQLGMLEISVEPRQAEKFQAELTARGWRFA
jgi:prephenate dehydrogenase